MFSGTKLSDKASDAEISASLDRLTAARDKLVENKPSGKTSVEPGALLNITV